MLYKYVIKDITHRRLLIQYEEKYDEHFANCERVFKKRSKLYSNAKLYSKGSVNHHLRIFFLVFCVCYTPIGLTCSSVPTFNHATPTSSLSSPKSSLGPPTSSHTPPTFNNAPPNLYLCSSNFSFLLPHLF